MSKAKRKPTRRYAQRTIGLLFGRSGNECAHPECTNPLIENETDQSDAQIVAHICHIYAISEDGPRGKSGLTESELNAPDNLILLCQHHHAVVDKQYETYTAGLLAGWKKQHEEKTDQRRLAPSENRLSGAANLQRYPTAIIDEKIETEVSVLRKSRFFVEFDRIGSAFALAQKTDTRVNSLAAATGFVAGRSHGVRVSCRARSISTRPTSISTSRRLWEPVRR